MDTVTADGVSVGAVNTYAFSYIYENHTIDVSFKALPVSLPAVETAPVKDITSSTAISGGEVISDGGATVTARGVCWSTSPLPTADNSHTNDGTGKGIFTSEITGLAPGITYYIRAYAANKEGRSYGEEIPFSTLCSLPAVTTDEVVSVSATETTGGGTVTDDGGCSVTARGLCWSISPSPTTDDDHTADGTGKGSFSSSITGLTSDTTYYIRAYAVNKQGTSYGDEIIFRTMTGSILSVIPEFQNVPKTGGSTTFSIENKGTGIMAWSVSEDIDWLSIETPVKRRTMAENNGNL